MERSEGSDSLEALARRVQERSARLNEERVIREPVASSSVPMIGPLVRLVRRLLNRLATRWYVAPQMESQARFAQEVTAAFDELASLLVMHEQALSKVGDQLGELKEKVDLLLREPAPTQAIFDILPSLPSEVLRAWEEMDLPAQDANGGWRLAQARAFDEAGVLHFPLTWTAQSIGWHYLFGLAVLGVALNCRPGDRVLDFAGGSGWVSEFLNRFAMHTVLLDYSETQLHYSRTRFAADRRLGVHARLDLIAGDGMQLPFADESFDGIVCMNAFHHMPSYEQALREMVRVLKPGGRAVFGEPGETHAQSPASQVSARDYRDLEKNVPLPLIYAYAKKVGFGCMWRYPYIYPESMQFPYPGGGEEPSTILEQMAISLPDWLRTLSFFALQKAGERTPHSDLPPLAASRHSLRAEITLLEHRQTVRLGDEWVERVRVKNAGDVVWLAAYRPFGGYVRLGVKLYDEGGRLVRDDLGRVSLPGDVAPSEEVELEVSIEAPVAPGRYLLKYHLVDEWRTWFEAAGSTAVDHRLLVLPSKEPEEAV